MCEQYTVVRSEPSSQPSDVMSLSKQVCISQFGCFEERAVASDHSISLSFSRLCSYLPLLALLQHKALAAIEHKGNNRCKTILCMAHLLRYIALSSCLQLHRVIKGGPSTYAATAICLQGLAI